MNKKNQPRFTRHGLWPLADFFSILLDVVARLDRDGQVSPAQPGDFEGRCAENPTVARGWDLKIRLDKVHYRIGSF
jgi:hypothetical protein